MFAPRRWPLLRGTRFVAGRRAPPRVERGFWGRRAHRYGIGSTFLGDGPLASHPVFGAAAVRVEAQRRDNPRVTTVEPEVLTPAGRRWVERTQGPLDLLAVIFLIDVILIWGFPDGPPAFVSALNVIAWIVWGCFAADYVARLLLSVGKARFVRTHKLDLLMVLLPMLRLLRIFLVLRRSLASVSTDRIAGSIVSLVVAAVFVSAFFMWRVEYNAPGATITTFRYCVVVGHRHHHDGGLRRLHTGHARGPCHRHGRHGRGRRTDRHGERHRGGVVRQAAQRARHPARRRRVGRTLSPRPQRPPTHRLCCWTASTNSPPSRTRFAPC